MRGVIIAVLILSIFAETPEECVRSKCAKEVTACELNVFCASKAVSCYNGCGKDMNNIKCLADCADESSNQKMINLDECGHRECGQYLNMGGCDTQRCVAELESQCDARVSMIEAISCLNQFLLRTPECECLKTIQ